MSFLIKSGEDATRLLRVLRSQFDAEDFEEEPLNSLEQMVALWDIEKPQDWLEVLQDATGKIEEFLMETEVELEFAHSVSPLLKHSALRQADWKLMSRFTARLSPDQGIKGLVHKSVLD